MAANNYFGFTHGGTQYSPQPAAAYQAAAQTAYVQPTHQAAYATAAAPRPAEAYQTYPAAHAPGQYAYAATRPQAAATYDATKAYYAPAAAAPAAAATAVYSVAETPYQTVHKATAKPAYNTATYNTQVQPRLPTAVKPQVTAHGTGTYNVYPSTTSTATTGAYTGAATTTSSTYSGYDAALYSAATSYYQQQQASKTGNTWQFKKGVQAVIKPKPKLPPKPPQLHYCEICKISCAGPQTYREHLEGQKHKKKEAAAAAATTTGVTTPSAPVARAQNQLRCELCDVSCTGTDAYAAHIRGAKHEKVMKLHQKLGKPIPSTEPVVVPVTGATTTEKPTLTQVKGFTSSTVPASKKLVAQPKITFVGGTTLKITGNKVSEEKPEGKMEEDESIDLKLLDKDVIPVGQEYIEEVKNEAGKIVSFNCKLCECKFNDPNAKEMHMKGRKHRLQYKKKVDPNLAVEVKPSIKARKVQEERQRRMQHKDHDFWRRREAEDNWRHEMRFMMEEEFYFMNRFGRMPPFMGPMGPMRRPETTDDRHVIAKHTSIYPNEGELQAVQNIVSSCEKALKAVSDFVAESDGHKPIVTPVKPEGEEVKEEKKEDSPARAVKGVMRVGVLAKGLLLHGDLNVQLVLLCSEKPTRTLLVRVADSLPKQLAAVAEGDQKFDVKMCVEEASVIVSSESEPRTTCKITLTSPIIRDDAKAEAADTPPVKDPPDVLDRSTCLEALAALRHAKWFQARANGLQSCVIIIRILRDLCQRVPTWTPLNQWAMELLVEKCVSSGGPNMTPGDALRRVFECIASGILLPGGPGLYDPCEKEARDCSSELSPQEREDITASAQHALRLIAFRQVHKVLGMDPLPAPRYIRRMPFQNPRKRRHTNSAGDENKTAKKEENAAVEGVAN